MPVSLSKSCGCLFLLRERHRQDFLRDAGLPFALGLNSFHAVRALTKTDYSPEEAVKGLIVGWTSDRCPCHFLMNLPSTVQALTPPLTSTAKRNGAVNTSIGPAPCSS